MTRYQLDTEKFEAYADACAEEYNRNKEEKGEEYAEKEQFKGITKVPTTRRDGGHFKHHDRED